MGEIFKKALGVFVDFKDDEEAPTPAALPDTAAAAVAPVVEPAADLAADPDIARARQAMQLLVDLPLAEIPVEKARKLIAGALQLGGLNAAELAGSFQRAAALYAATVQAEQEAIASRQQVNAERIALLEKALAEEKEQCGAEVAERGRRIEQAQRDLAELQKATAFFAAE